MIVREEEEEEEENKLAKMKQTFRVRVWFLFVARALLFSDSEYFKQSLQKQLLLYIANIWTFLLCE